jgi:hypothetical protein
LKPVLDVFWDDSFHENFNVIIVVANAYVMVCVEDVVELSLDVGEFRRKLAACDEGVHGLIMSMYLFVSEFPHGIKL